MTQSLHGITTTSTENIILGPGAIYSGWASAGAPGTLIGATKGGSSLAIKRTIRDIRPDGAFGPVVGFRRDEDISAVLKTSLFEVTEANILAALPGAAAVTHLITFGEIDDADYIDSVAIVAPNMKAATGKAWVVGNLANCLMDGEFSLKLEPHNESTLDLQYTAHFTSADLVTRPYKITYLDGTLATSGVSTDTSGRLLLDAGSIYLGYHDSTSPGTLLGATKGGITASIKQTISDRRPDGAIGPLKSFRRRDELIATIKVNVMELSVDNIRRALLANVSSGTTTITDEAVGTGNSVLTEFALDHTHVVENSEVVTLNAAAQTRGTHYTVDYTNGLLQFFTAPGAYAIVATYDYISGEAELTTEEVDDTQYLSNVAVLVKVSGKTNPLVFKITNCLCDGAIDLKAAPKDEVVSELTFTGHYSASALTTHPVSILFPAS